MKVVQAIVPVAGLGTRMLPLSHAIPKELLPLADRAALQYVAEELAAAGVQRMRLVISESKRGIERIFDDDESIRRIVETKPELQSRLWMFGPHAALQVDTAIQPEQNGLGDAILCGMSGIEDQPIVVALGDCVLGMGGRSNTVRRMIEVMENENVDAVIAFQNVSSDLVSRYGIAVPGESLAPPSSSRSEFVLRGIVEKPSRESAPSNWAVAARYVFSSRLGDYLRNIEPDAKGEIQLTAAIAAMIADGAHVIGVSLEPGEERFDMGNYRSWAEAFVRFAVDADPSLRETFRHAIGLNRE